MDVRWVKHELPPLRFTHLSMPFLALQVVFVRSGSHHVNEAFAVSFVLAAFLPFMHPRTTIALAI